MVTTSEDRIYASYMLFILILVETNIFAPENGWCEDDCFLFGPGLFSEAIYSFVGCIYGGVSCWSAKDMYIYICSYVCILKYDEICILLASFKVRSDDIQKM